MLPQLPWARRNARECTRSCRWHEKTKLFTPEHNAEPWAWCSIRDAGYGDERGLATMDRHLGDHAFFVGDDLTIADVALYAYSHLAPEGGFDLGRFPAVRAWMGRVESRPRFFAGPEAYTQAAMVAPAIA
jgi:glutathione S-transferase